MHAYSSVLTGNTHFAISQRRDGRGAFSTNLTYDDGTYIVHTYYV